MNVKICKMHAKRAVLPFPIAPVKFSNPLCLKTYSSINCRRWPFLINVLLAVSGADRHKIVFITSYKTHVSCLYVFFRTRTSTWMATALAFQRGVELNVALKMRLIELSCSRNLMIYRKTLRCFAVVRMHTRNGWSDEEYLIKYVKYFPFVE